MPDGVVPVGRRCLGCLPPTAGGYSQYDKLDMHAFARLLKAAVRRFGKICLCLTAPTEPCEAPHDRVESLTKLELSDSPCALTAITRKT